MACFVKRFIKSAVYGSKESLRYRVFRRRSELDLILKRFLQVRHSKRKVTGFRQQPQKPNESRLRNGDIVEQQLENSLQAVLRARFGQKFIVPNWKGRAFGFYTDNADFPKMDVLEATVNVASASNLKLLPSTQKSLQNQVSLASTPSDVLPHMSAALDAAKPAIVF